MKRGCKKPWCWFLIIHLEQILKGMNARNEISVMTKRVKWLITDSSRICGNWFCLPRSSSWEEGSEILRFFFHRWIFLPGIRVFSFKSEKRAVSGKFQLYSVSFWNSRIEKNIFREFGNEEKYGQGIQGWKLLLLGNFNFKGINVCGITFGGDLIMRKKSSTKINSCINNKYMCHRSWRKFIHVKLISYQWVINSHLF